MTPMGRSDEEQLDALFRAYAALPVPEPSANFMPGIWHKIEARQTFTWSLGKFAHVFLTAAAALSLALGIFAFVPHSATTQNAPSYLEALADANPIQAPDLVSPARMDLPEAQR